MTTKPSHTITKRSQHQGQPPLTKSAQNRLGKLIGGKLRPFLLKRFKTDEEALWSLTNFQIGADLCQELLRLPGITEKSTITDAFAGAGGNTIQFSKHFHRVNAVELNPSRKRMLDENIGLFAIDNATTHLSHYQSIADTLVQNVIFFDPPWGSEYRTKGKGELRILVDSPSAEQEELEAVILRSAGSTQYCVAKLPNNYDMSYFMAKLGAAVTIVETREYTRPNSSVFVYMRRN